MAAADGASNGKTGITIPWAAIAIIVTLVIQTIIFYGRVAAIEERVSGVIETVRNIREDLRQDRAARRRGE